MGAGRHAQQALADPDGAVQRGDGRQLPTQGHQAERQQVQRVEDDGRERRIGERQREVRRLVGVDVAVQRAGVVERGRSAEVDVQVDEVRAVGDQVRPGQARGDARDEQQRAATARTSAARRVLGAAGAAEVVSIRPTLAIGARAAVASVPR